MLHFGFESALFLLDMLDYAGRIQHQHVTIDSAESVVGLSTITKEHVAILIALRVKKPSLDPQLNLL